MESLISLVRDDLARRGLSGAVGEYVDVIVGLYPVENLAKIGRIRDVIEEVRSQQANRTPSGLVGAGISRPATSLAALRDAYREAEGCAEYRPSAWRP